MFCFTFSSIGALLALGLRAWLVEGREGGREGGGEGEREGTGERGFGCFAQIS